MDKIKTKKKGPRYTAKERPPIKEVTPSLCRKHFFDTEYYWYYYTEIRKE